MSRIYKKASTAILGYQTLLNAKVTGRFCLLPFPFANVGSRFACVRSFRKRVIIRFTNDFHSNGVKVLFCVKKIVIAKNLRAIARSLSL